MKLIFSFFNIHRQQLLIVFFVVCLFLISTQFVFADPPGAPGYPAQTDDSGWIGNALANMVLGIALGIGGIFSWLGGNLLDGAVNYTILKAGNILGDNSTFGLGAGIQQMWKVVRDIFNIVFIFSFIYIGIKTILNADDSGAKRSLGYLIIAALLINFSLYFTQVIIDFSNIAAVQIYNQINSGGILTSNVGSTAAIRPATTGVSGAFANTLSLSNFFDSGIVGAGQILLFAVMGMIFLIIAGIVFAMGGILLIRRFITLIIYMILSPIMFAGWIFPAFMSYQEKWRKGFIQQAFFAPAFLFMIYLSLMVLQSMKRSFGITEDGYGAMLQTGDVSAFSIFLFFTMGVGFLYASIKVGEMMGAAGAAGALKSLDALKNSTSAVAQSYAYRNTAGRGLNQVVKQLDKLDQAADGGHRGARFLRAVGVDESVRRSVEKASNKGIGGGRGRKEVKEDEKTASERTAQTNAAIELKTNITAGSRSGATDAEKIAMETSLAGASVKDLEKLAKTKEGFALLEKISGNLPEKKFESLLDSKEFTPEQLEKLGAGRVASVKTNIINAGGTGSIKDGIKNASTEELNALDFNELINNAMYVQSGQLDKLESKWGDEKMRIFKNKRKADMLGLIARGPIGIQQLLATTKGEKEIAKLPSELFKNIAGTGPGAGPNLDNFIINTTSAGTLSAGLLQNIATDSGLTGADKKEMGRAIKTHYTSPATGILSLPKDIAGFFHSGQGAVFN